MHTDLHVAAPVAEALASHQPVVALESTVISHGLPYPANVETALAMQSAIQNAGAIPATIAVLNGKITVGLDTDQIEHLGSQPAGTIRKCSRRDLPIAVGLDEDAATTVAGTMIVAHMAGIRVFATGGIGGVHRGQPFDTSADLIELGRTPVAVVCSGAKSILDLPLTLEVLETQGVPVVGMDTDTFPAFYTRSSGLPIDVRVDSPQQAARIIAAAQRLQIEHGLLIAVPVPADDELPEAIAEKAIQQATDEAFQQHVQGKALTPFLLARIAEITGGQSKQANTALLVNNARVAASIASELARL
jgi:pseudouridine-5'-phosphate glycosidase